MMTGIAASILFIIGFYIFNKDGESETQDVLVAQVSKPVEVEKETSPVSKIIEEQQKSSVSQVPNSSKPKKHARHQDALPANHEEASTETADADIAQEMADIIACMDIFEQQLLSE